MKDALDIASLDASQLPRHHTEEEYSSELEELQHADTRQRPPNWKLSPGAVAMFVLDGELDNGFSITPKSIGDRRLIEVAIATLATDRALLLYGLPGTAKSGVSEHFVAAISGSSTRMSRGTAGVVEESIR